MSPTPSRVRGKYVGTTWAQIGPGGNQKNAKFAGLANWDTTDGVDMDELDVVYDTRAVFRLDFEDEFVTNVEHSLLNSTGLVTEADVNLDGPRPYLLSNIATNMLRPLDSSKVYEFASEADDDDATVGFKSVRVAVLSNTDVNFDGVTSALDRAIVVSNLGMDAGALMHHGDIDNDGDVDQDDLAMFTLLPGDYNDNNELDTGDLDLQAAAIAGGQNPSEFDLNGDGVVDYDGDRIMWLHELKKVYVGDADLNGEFDSADFVTVFVAGKYETGAEAGWAEGDWDANLAFDSGDFVAAFIEGGYETGEYPGGVQAVPEPTSLVLALCGLLGCLRAARRR